MAVHSLDDNQINFFFIVTLLECKEKTRGDKYLPYELLGYDTNMTLEIVETENFFRPGLLIPCQDRSEGLYNTRNKASKKTRIDIANFRFWGIHYKTIDRFGYDEEQCDQIPVIDDNEVASIQQAFSRSLNHDEFDPSTVDSEPDLEDGDDGDDDSS